VETLKVKKLKNKGLLLVLMEEFKQVE